MNNFKMNRKTIKLAYNKRKYLYNVSKKKKIMIAKF